MTDPKPAPPATDDCICEDVRVLGACPVHEPRSTEPANDDLVAAWLADLQGMDDADREHDVTVLDTRSLLLRIAADAETIKAERARADKYEAESEQKGADLMAAEAVIESLKADAAQWDAIIKDNDATRTIRDLRETIRKQAEEIERLKADRDNASDGHHTFKELYEHRHALFAAVSKSQGGWKSKLHDDGTMFDGWFIAGCTTPQGPITYHLPLEWWDAFPAVTLAKAPAWDGHTSTDVVGRIKSLLGTPVELATLRAQVETLRAALAGVLPGIDEAWALWPEGRNAVLKARAAIAATEPKG